MRELQSDEVAGGPHEKVVRKTFLPRVAQNPSAILHFEKTIVLRQAGQLVLAFQHEHAGEQEQDWGDHKYRPTKTFVAVA